MIKVIADMNEAKPFEKDEETKTTRQNSYSYALFAVFCEEISPYKLN